MSEIRVDTISERTNANGVTIDGLTIKDGGITATTGVVVFSDANTRLRLMESDTTDVNTQLQNQGGDFIIATVNDAGDSATERLIIDHATGRVGIGTTPDLGAGLHIRVSDSGASANANADELVIENSGDAGLSILSGNGSSGTINFADDGANNRGILTYDHSADQLKFGVAGSIVARFTSSGLAIGGSGAANTLDDYEEGTWTPVLVSDATAAAYTSQTGVYTKIGRMVYINCQVRMSDVGSFAGATTQINGLPFTSSNNSTDNIGVLYMSGTASVVTNSYVRIPANSAFLRLEEGAGTTGVDNSLNANHLDTGTTVRFSMVYFT